MKHAPNDISKLFGFDSRKLNGLLRSISCYNVRLCCTTIFYLPNRRKYLWGDCCYFFFFFIACAAVYFFFSSLVRNLYFKPCVCVSIFRFGITYISFFFTFNWTVLKAKQLFFFLFILSKSNWNGVFHSQNTVFDPTKKVSKQII